MGRPRSPNRDAAFELYKQNGGKIISADIAVQLGEKVAAINNWRTQDKWKDSLGKPGAPKGNQTAVGNKDGELGEEYEQLYPRLLLQILTQADL